MELELQMTHSAGPLDFVQLFWALEPLQLRCHGIPWNTMECCRTGSTTLSFPNKLSGLFVLIQVWLGGKTLKVTRCKHFLAF